MKKRTDYLNLWLVAVMIMFAACSNDNEPKGNGSDTDANVPQAVNSAFQKQFPAATDVKWTERNNYYVANFSLKGKSRAASHKGDKNEAWYTAQGKCSLSELELPVSEFETNPEYGKVLAAWKGSRYHAEGYEIDDIDVLLRTENAADRIVKIEVEKGDKEYDLYFTMNGKLVREVLDEDGDDENEPCPQELADYIEKTHKGAVIVDFEKEEEKGQVTYEVEILIQIGTMEVEKELVFDKDFQFLYAEIEIEEDVLAELVTKLLSPDKIEEIIKITGESDPKEWDIEIIEDSKGIITVFVESEEGEPVAVLKLNASLKPIA